MKIPIPNSKADIGTVLNVLKGEDGKAELRVSSKSSAISCSRSKPDVTLTIALDLYVSCRALAA
jgi:hypothetical protein